MLIPLKRKMADSWYLLKFRVERLFHLLYRRYSDGKVRCIGGCKFKSVNFF